jgi:hypothetical protein
MDMGILLEDRSTDLDVSSSDNIVSVSFINLSMTVLSIVVPKGFLSLNVFIFLPVLSIALTK